MFVLAQPAAQSSQPWWGIPVIIGSFTLLAALLAQIVAVTIERRKNRRDDDQRWDSEKRRIYAEFMAATYECTTAISKGWLAKEAEWAGVPEMLHKAVALRYEIVLMGSEAMSERSDSVLRLITSAMQSVRSEERGREGRDDFLARSRDEIRSFVDQARTELGTRAGRRSTTPVAPGG